MPYWKYFVEDNICSIINVKADLKPSGDLLPIALSSALLLQILMLAACTSSSEITWVYAFRMDVKF